MSDKRTDEIRARLEREKRVFDRAQRVRHGGVAYPQHIEDRAYLLERVEKLEAEHRDLDTIFEKWKRMMP